MSRYVEIITRAIDSIDTEVVNQTGGEITQTFSVRSDGRHALRIALPAAEPETSADMLEWCRVRLATPNLHPAAKAALEEMQTHGLAFVERGGPAVSVPMQPEPVENLYYELLGAYMKALQRESGKENPMVPVMHDEAMEAVHSYVLRVIQRDQPKPPADLVEAMSDAFHSAPDTGRGSVVDGLEACARVAQGRMERVREACVRAMPPCGHPDLCDDGMHCKCRECKARDVVAAMPLPTTGQAHVGEARDYGNATDTHCVNCGASDSEPEQWEAACPEATTGQEVERADRRELLQGQILGAACPACGASLAIQYTDEPAALRVTATKSNPQPEPPAPHLRRELAQACAALGKPSRLDLARWMLPGLTIEQANAPPASLVEAMRGAMENALNDDTPDTVSEACAKVADDAVRGALNKVANFYPPCDEPADISARDCAANAAESVRDDPLPDAGQPEGEVGRARDRCPQCRGEVRLVTQGEYAWMNSDQFNAVKAGDYYCPTCDPNGRDDKGKYCYWWEHELVAAEQAGVGEAGAQGGDRVLRDHLTGARTLTPDDLKGQPESEVGRQCPDGGACHHKCTGASCFRVRCCGPLSDVYKGNEWPGWIIAAEFREDTGHHDARQEG